MYENYNSTNSYKAYDSSNKQSVGYLIAKVFGIMFIALIITGLVAILLAYGFINWLSVDPITAVKALDGSLIISGIGLIILSISLPISFSRGKHSILIPGILFAILMGVLFSTFVLFIDVGTLVLAIGSTCGIFGIMALISFLGKGNFNSLYTVGSGLLIGCLFLVIFNLFTQSGTLSLIVSLLFFAAIMLITLWDLRRIKLIAERGLMNNNNVTLYCAFIIYTDFISILIRLIYYISFSKRS